MGSSSSWISKEFSCVFRRVSASKQALLVLRAVVLMAAASIYQLFPALQVASPRLLRRASMDALRSMTLATMAEPSCSKEEGKAGSAGR